MFDGRLFINFCLVRHTDYKLWSYKHIWADSVDVSVFPVCVCVCVCVYIYIYIYIYTQSVTGGTDQTSGGCSLC